LSMSIPRGDRAPTSGDTEGISYSAYVSALFVDNFIYARLRNARRIDGLLERYLLRSVDWNGISRLGSGIAEAFR
jgi:hypothetical protein